MNGRYFNQKEFRTTIVRVAAAALLFTGVIVASTADTGAAMAADTSRSVSETESGSTDFQSAQSANGVGVRFAQLLAEGRYDQILQISLQPQTQCPLFSGEKLAALCENVATGEVVRGYATGTLGSDATLLSYEDALIGLAAIRSQFNSTDFQVLSYARTGRLGGSFECSGCWTVIIGTGTAREPLSGNLPLIIDLQVAWDADEPRIYSLSLGGLTDRAWVDGGVSGDGRNYTVTAPGPPATGTGISPGRSSAADGTARSGAAFVFVLTAVAGASAIAVNYRGRLG